MVVFICNVCGQSVKKALVDKHWQTQCRNCTGFSCIDCGKDFPGDSYRNHNQCMTEEEKWFGADYKPKNSANSGQKKQDAWTESIQAAIAKAKSGNPQLSDVLSKLLNYDNVPRKEAKFKNFLKNSMRVNNFHIISAVWNVVAAVKSQDDKNTPVEALEGKKVEHGSKAVDSSLSADTLPGSSDAINAAVVLTEALVGEANLKPVLDEEVPSSSVGKFKWKRTIFLALSEPESTTVSTKKLKKRVLKKYAEHHGDAASDVPYQELDKKFQKYLNKYPNLFSVEGKMVNLLPS